MPDPETRYPCPVCLGVTMEKTPVGAAGKLLVDHCPRCGGVWFEAGEVQQLREVNPAELWSRIAPRGEVHRAHCHQCHTPMERSTERCPVCSHPNLLDCPVCAEPMKVAAHGGLRLDTCARCKGIWFDHHELASIWQLELGASLERRGARRGGVGMDDGALILLDALTWHPGLVFYGAHAAGHAVTASVHALANAPEAAGAVVEAAGEAATSVFETILEIIQSFFE